jgi:hypothetical protein
MKIIFFDDHGKAERRLRAREVNHLIVDHYLTAGEKVTPDSHKSNEWIILGPGKGACRIQIKNEIKSIGLDAKKTTVICVPKGKIHSFEAVTNLAYTVLRDGLD